MVPLVIGSALIILMLALGLLPRLVLAQWKGKARAFDLGYSGEGLPIEVGGGYARMSLGSDQVRAHMIRADLQSREILCRLDQINGGSTAAIASTHILHFQVADTKVVAAAWARATGTDSLQSD